MVSSRPDAEGDYIMHVYEQMGSLDAAAFAGCLRVLAMLAEKHPVVNRVMTAIDKELGNITRDAGVRDESL